MLEKRKILSLLGFGSWFAQLPQCNFMCNIAQDHTTFHKFCPDNMCYNLKCYYLTWYGINISIYSVGYISECPSLNTALRDNATFPYECVVI